MPRASFYRSKGSPTVAAQGPHGVHSKTVHPRDVQLNTVPLASKQTHLMLRQVSQRWDRGSSLRHYSPRIPLDTRCANRHISIGEGQLATALAQGRVGILSGTSRTGALLTLPARALSGLRWPPLARVPPGAMSSVFWACGLGCLCGRTPGSDAALRRGALAWVGVEGLVGVVALPGLYMSPS